MTRSQNTTIKWQSIALNDTAQYPIPKNIQNQSADRQLGTLQGNGQMMNLMTDIERHPGFRGVGKGRRNMDWGTAWT